MTKYILTENEIKRIVKVIIVKKYLHKSLVTINCAA